MTAIEVPHPDRSMRRRRASRSGHAIRFTLWAYDIGVSLLALFAGTEGAGSIVPGSLVWLLVYGLTVFRITLQPTFFFGVLSRNAAILAFPAVCLASIVWSVSPGVGIVPAMQLTMTIVIGMHIGSRLTLSQICLGLFAVTCLTTLLSLVNWQTQLFGKAFDAGHALLGVFPQKNLLGKSTYLGLLSGLALLLMPVRPFLKVFGILPAMATMALALFLSQSVTSILLAPIFSAVLLALNFRRFHPATILLVAIGVVAVVGLAPIVFVVIGIDPVTAILKAFGKGATLTGRTGLWEIAERVLQQHWLVGVGYNAFWYSPKFVAQQFLGQQIGGDAIRAFHQFLLEIWVATGVPGVVAIVTMLGATLRRSVRLWLRTLGVGPAYGIAMTLAIIATAMLNPNLYRQHELCILMIAAIAVSARESLARHATPASVPDDENDSG